MNQCILKNTLTNNLFAQFFLSRDYLDVFVHLAIPEVSIGCLCVSGTMFMRHTQTLPFWSSLKKGQIVNEKSKSNCVEWFFFSLEKWK